MIVARGFCARDAADAVDVTGDEMAVEAAGNRKRPFQIHQRARSNELQIGTLPGFMQKIEVDRRGPLLSAYFNDSQTATVDCQAVSESETFGAGAGDDRKTNPGR